jgi:hypothetical protein
MTFWLRLADVPVRQDTGMSSRHRDVVLHNDLSATHASRAQHPGEARRTLFNA